MNADYRAPGASLSVTRGGWNIGADAQFALAPQWSAEAQSAFLDFGRDNLKSSVKKVGAN